MYGWVHTHAQVVFNLEVGGYFSIKRNIMSVPAPFSVTQEQLVPFTEALLKVFRWVRG
jgi:ferredoxin-nitrite reductase